MELRKCHSEQLPQRLANVWGRKYHMPLGPFWIILIHSAHRLHQQCAPICFIRLASCPQPLLDVVIRVIYVQLVGAPGVFMCDSCREFSSQCLELTLQASERFTRVNPPDTGEVIDDG